MLSKIYIICEMPDKKVSKYYLEKLKNTPGYWKGKEGDFLHFIKVHKKDDSKIIEFLEDLKKRGEILRYDYI